MGEQGPPGPRTGEVTYVRWGRTTCPNTTGTELVYAARAVGSYYTHEGGSNDYLCLPDEPQYLAYKPGTQANPLHGVEYCTSANQPLKLHAMIKSTFVLVWTYMHGKGSFCGLDCRFGGGFLWPRPERASWTGTFMR